MQRRTQSRCARTAVGKRIAWCHCFCLPRKSRCICTRNWCCRLLLPLLFSCFLSRLLLRKRTTRGGRRFLISPHNASSNPNRCCQEYDRVLNVVRCGTPAKSKMVQWCRVRQLQAVLLGNRILSPTRDQPQARFQPCRSWL